MADERTEKQKVQEITDKLEEGLKELFESEKYKTYLSTMSKFHNYSFNNTLLIAMQKPEATLVAGYKAWQKNFERHVNKGEKAIRILAPAPYKIKEERDKLDPVTGEMMFDENGIRANIEMLEQQMEDEVSLKRRVEDFKKALSQNEVLQEFDRGIFESIIEKVIVGGYDEDGNKDPYKITFIYKTGFRNEVGNAKQRFDKTKSVGDKAKELCSHIADEVKDVCSYVSDNTCGDGVPLSSEKSGDTYQH